MRIILSGISGFPFGLAEAQKQRLIAKALKYAGHNVWIFNRSGVYKKEDGYKIKRIGISTNIAYLHCYKNPYKSSNKLIRYFQKIFGYFFEFYFLIRLKPDAVIVSTKSFFNLVFYSSLSFFLRYKFFITWVELNSSIKSRKSIFFRISDYLFENVSFYFVDGILPISEFLADIVKKKRPHLPMLKIPTLVDMNYFNDKKISNFEPDYFLFCGSAAYFEIITFIVNSFDQVDNQNFKLFLVTNGSKDSVMKVENKVTQSLKRHLIKVIPYVPYEQLVEYYMNARALLIPLKPDKRDIARFPHKIGEYTASGNPIITIGVGEILYYFEDGKNALIAKNYNIKEFSEKMKYVVDFPEKSKIIGINGYKTCLENFNYKIYGTKITNFFNSIN